MCSLQKAGNHFVTSERPITLKIDNFQYEKELYLLFSVIMALTMWLFAFLHEYDETEYQPEQLRNIFFAVFILSVHSFCFCVCGGSSVCLCQRHTGVS